MPIRPGKYANLLESAGVLKWKHAEGDLKGFQEALLHRNKDGSSTYLLRIQAGAEFPEPFAHSFSEESYYISGVMLNTKTDERVTGGTYVFNKAGKKHGPFKCLESCLILEFRYSG